MLKAETHVLQKPEIIATLCQQMPQQYNKHGTVQVGEIARYLRVKVVLRQPATRVLNQTIFIKSPVWGIFYTYFNSPPVAGGTRRVGRVFWCIRNNKLIPENCLPHEVLTKCGHSEQTTVCVGI